MAVDNFHWKINKVIFTCSTCVLRFPFFPPAVSKKWSRGRLHPTEGAEVSRCCGRGEGGVAEGSCDHVITVGPVRPVFSWSWETFRAMSMRGASITWGTRDKWGAWKKRHSKGSGFIHMLTNGWPGLFQDCSPNFHEQTFREISVDTWKWENVVFKRTMRIPKHSVQNLYIQRVREELRPL